MTQLSGVPSYTGAVLSHLYPNATEQGYFVSSYKSTYTLHWDQAVMGSPIPTVEEIAAAEYPAYLSALFCTRLQARLELLDKGLWDSVMAWASAAGGVIQAFFEDAQNWRFNDASFQAGITALGLTEEQAVAMMESARKR